MAEPVAPNERTVIVTTAMLAADSGGYVPRDHYLVLVEGWEAGLRLERA